MYCRKCGSKIVDDAAFCIVCGAKITTEAPSTDIRSHEHSSSDPLDIMPSTKELDPSSISDTPVSASDSEAPPISPYITPTQTMKKSHKPTKILLIAASIFIALTAIGVLTRYLVIDKQYQDAIQLMEDNHPSEALEQFRAIQTHKDAADYIIECQNMMDYDRAMYYFNNNQYEEALAYFEKLEPYRDASYYIQECVTILDYFYYYMLMEEGQYQEAYDGFVALGKFEDSVAFAVECQNHMRYQDAVAFMEQSDYPAAKKLLQKIPGFLDADALYEECEHHIIYDQAQNALGSGENYDAFMLFGSIRGFLDAAQRQDECIVPTPPASELSRSPDIPTKGISITIVAPQEDLMLNAYLKIYSDDNVLMTTVFIPRGEKFRIYLPAGSYMIKTGYGWDWFGEHCAFGSGDNAIYSVLLFDRQNEYWTIQSGYSYTLTLMPESSGNIGGRSEDPDNF